MESENTALSGMKAITDYCRSINMPAAEATIMSHIINEGFPAKKLGGIWESDRALIIEWRKNRLTTGNGNGAVTAPEPGKNRNPKKIEQKKNKFGLTKR